MFRRFFVLFILMFFIILLGGFMFVIIVFFRMKDVLEIIFFFGLDFIVVIYVVSCLKFDYIFIEFMCLVY